MSKLGKELKLIYDYEINKGNLIEQIDEPAGTSCPLAITFKKKLFFIGSNEENDLTPNITFWESRDPHYPLQSGYKDSVSNYVICGPLT